VAEYSQVLAGQELGLKPSFLRETLADGTPVIRGSLKRGYTVDWKCVHAHGSAADARQCAREELRRLWFASHGESVQKISSPEDRLTFNVSRPARAAIDLARNVKGWSKTDATNRALDLLGQVLTAEREGIPVRIGEDRIRFLG
jgi:hypothetical protein